jgi:hypothetical protein
MASARANCWKPICDLADTDRSLARQLTELLELIRQYGPDVVAGAIEKASAARPLVADYVANIVRQQQSPRRPQPPVPLRDPQLRDLVTIPYRCWPMTLSFLTQPSQLQ